jgi:proteic killer suppression protein
MIVSFGDRTTEALYHGETGRLTRAIPPDIHRTALRKLDMLEAASDLSDLRSPPGNRLEALRGDLKGLHSIRINDQWRIVFRWTSNGPTEVRVVDYHA